MATAAAFESLVGRFIYSFILTDKLDCIFQRIYENNILIAKIDSLRTKWLIVIPTILLV